MAPFPASAAAIAMVPVITDGLVESIIFSFLPYMIAEMGVPPNEVGYYSGLLGSTRSIALLFSAVFWGRLSDRYGRKPFLQAGLCVMAVCQILFGLSRTLGQALACRAALGLLAANLSVSKAFLREVTPPEHRALAFSFMGTGYGGGFFVGSILGGALAQPAKTMPAVFGGEMWVDHPYLLPCLVSVVGVPIGLLALPYVAETAGPNAKARTPPSDGGAAERNAATDLPAARDGEAEGGAGASSASAASSAAAVGAPAAAARTAADAAGYEHGDDPDLRLVRTGGSLGRACVIARRGCSWCLGSPLVCVILGAALMGWIFQALAEIFPLFIANVDHGLGMPPSQLGAALSPMGISILVVPLLAPRFIKRFSAPVVFRGSVCIQLLVSICMPSLRLVSSSQTVLWSGLIAMSLLRGFGGSLNFVATSVLLNSMITHRAGFYNGLNDSIGSLFRATAPLSAGAIFAASTSSADAAFPFDEHLGFFCVGLVCLLTLGLSRGIDAAARSAKKGEDASAGAGAIALSSTKAQIETRTGGREGGG